MGAWPGMNLLGGLFTLQLRGSEAVQARGLREGPALASALWGT